MNTIYKQRIGLNNWEITGIENYLVSNFDATDTSYSDKTIHLDFNDKCFGVYKISDGEDLYITEFNDGIDNVTYRLNLVDNSFHQISENFDFITEVENIFI